VRTTNEKWVGTCPPVPYGFGAYGPMSKNSDLEELRVRRLAVLKSPKFGCL